MKKPNYETEPKKADATKAADAFKRVIEILLTLNHEEQQRVLKASAVFLKHDGEDWI